MDGIPPKKIIVPKRILGPEIRKQTGQNLYMQYVNGDVTLVSKPPKPEISDLMRWPAYMRKLIEEHKEQPYYPKLLSALNAMRHPYGYYDVFILHDPGCAVFSEVCLCTCDPDIDIRERGRREDDFGIEGRRL
jgi:hypothetical protein